MFGQPNVANGHNADENHGDTLVWSFNLSDFIEKDYVSKKVIYGWDNSNSEAYNSINLLEKFLTDNKMKKSDFSIVDFDKNQLPVKKFDLVISLYSLDYHYDLKFYIDYLKKICTKDTLLIFLALSQPN